jgi:hypothetical protein
MKYVTQVLWTATMMLAAVPTTFAGDAPVSMVLFTNANIFNRKDEKPAQGLSVLSGFSGEPRISHTRSRGMRAAKRYIQKGDD